MGESKNEVLDSLKSILKERVCPSICKAVPAWPSQIKDMAEWLGLHNTNFIYTHHSSHSNKLENSRLHVEEDRSKYTNDFDIITENLFCVPSRECERLLSILRQSKGGSILVTGYRGTGKSSMVNYTISRLIKEEDNKTKESKESTKYDYVPIRINLSTARTAMALVMMMIKELHHRTKSGRIDNERHALITEVYHKFIRIATSQELKAKEYGTKYGGEAGISSILSILGAKISGEVKREQTEQSGSAYQETLYTLHEAQQDLHRCLKLLNANNYRVIFILDELDKLSPRSVSLPDSHYSKKLIEIQTIVSDLKFLLTEANAFHIFIAGKDVDDSWQEDQNKGEGLFESIFVQNIYLPSAFSVHLESAVGPHRWIQNLYLLWQKYLFCSKVGRIVETKRQKVFSDILSGKDVFNIFKKADKDEFKKFADAVPKDWKDRVFQLILGELGISPKTWSYNTGLLVLPNLSEYELYRLMLRYSEREKSNTVKTDDKEVEVVKIDKWLQFIQELLKSAKEGNADVKIDLPVKEEVAPMTARRCLRLRYLIQYLTYKGRGIPRKILREFYALVQHRNVIKADEGYWEKRGNVNYIIYEPTALRQKIKFFANIVMLLESNQEVFRALNDKGCVAIFHIIDYILKFYQTGFSWGDIENASFMTHREELYPSRELVDTILEILEDHIITRMERRQKVYGLLPRIKHDLDRLYMAFGPEQIELRFTKTDFASEMEQLKSKILKVEKIQPEQRLESFKTQIRIGKLYELLGNLQEAIHEYSKALRWIRMDINRMINNEVHSNLINDTAVITYLSICADTLQRLGYLYELNGELKYSLHYYQSAVRLIQASWRFTKIETNSILDTQTNPPLLTNALYIDFPELLRTGNVNSVNSAESGVSDVKLEGLIAMMVPENVEDVRPFTGNLLKSEDKSDVRSRPANYAFGPIGLPSLLNSIAVLMDKLWHRYASNKYMLLTLDLYISQFDEHKTIDQMIFIGEMAMRRRDIRLAASWYWLALEKMIDYQSFDNPDKIGKKTGIRSSSRARLLEYLGDVYFATGGTVLLNSNQLGKLQPGAISQEISKKKKEIGNKANILNNDYDDAEYFYDCATYLYKINNQNLWVFDVYLKRLAVRFEKLFKSLVTKNDGGEGNPEFSAENYWDKFWEGAEIALSVIINTRPYVKKVQSLEKGQVTDQRRFGTLFTLIGRIFMMVAHRGESHWYFEKETGAREGTINRINRILGQLLDNNQFKGPDSIWEKDGIGNRSVLWHLASLNWRSLITGEEAFKWLNDPNVFLIGQLYHIVEWSKTSLSEVDLGKRKQKVKMLYLAEVSLLGAYLALDDNLRDLESADSSHRLGLLYLQAIQLLKELVAENSSLQPTEKSFSVFTFTLYTTLHLASKRYLVNAISIHHVERRHARCFHHDLAQIHRALGDLLLIRAEILEKESNDTLWTQEIVSENKNLQDSQIKDTEINDVRFQAVESYRDVCKEFLSEIDDYIKRYRFPNDSYFLHKNIMDGKMHFDICNMIHVRHWDYKNIKVSQKSGSKPAQDLSQISVSLAEELIKPFPPVDDKNEWLKGLYSTFELIKKMNPTSNYLEIVKKSKSYKIQNVQVQSQYPSGDKKCSKFFRSFDDGLGNTTQKKEK